MKRIPRPLGATQTSMLYQRESTKENKRKLHTLILLAYSNQQLYWLYSTHTFIPVPEDKSSKYLKPKPSKKQEKKTNKNKEYISVYTIENIRSKEVCIGLGLAPDKLVFKVEALLAKRAKKVLMGTGYQEVQDLAARAQISGILKMALDSGMRLNTWAEELMAVARIRNYAPLQLKEANSALGNQLSGLNTIFNMYNKQLPQSTKPGIQVNNQINTNVAPNTTENGMLLTTTQAVQLLEEKGLSTQPLDLASLATIHGLDDPSIPNIKALPEDAQGVKAFDVKDLQFSSHEDRREEELNVTQVEMPKAKKAKKNKVPQTLNI